MENTEKLQKILASLGLGSRRQLEKMIAEGRVSVNGQISKLGDRASANDKIRVDGKLVDQATRSKTRILLYNKPVGQVCTRNDPEGRPTVFDHLPYLRNSRWVSIGRLDINTSGLLVLTNDGELANQLMHPRYGIEREYSVRVLGEVNQEILNRLKQGVMLDDGEAKFEKIVDAGGEGANHWYHVVLTEGKNREVRRLWESQGVVVSRLIRLRYGDLTLPRFLQRGRWYELEPEAVKQLLAKIHGKK